MKLNIKITAQLIPHLSKGHWILPWILLLHLYVKQKIVVLKFLNKN